MGHIDLLTAQALTLETQKKLGIIRNQLDLLNTYLRNLREIEAFRTVDVGGLTLLDITSTRADKA
jgi:hypothetical protein